MRFLWLDSLLFVCLVVCLQVNHCGWKDSFPFAIQPWFSGTIVVVASSSRALCMRGRLVSIELHCNRFPIHCCNCNCNCRYCYCRCQHTIPIFDFESIPWMHGRFLFIYLFIHLFISLLIWFGGRYTISSSPLELVCTVHYCVAICIPWRYTTYWLYFGRKCDGAFSSLKELVVVVVIVLFLLLLFGGHGQSFVVPPFDRSAVAVGLLRRLGLAVV